MEVKPIAPPKKAREAEFSQDEMRVIVAALLAFRMAQIKGKFTITRDMPTSKSNGKRVVDIIHGMLNNKLPYYKIDNLSRPLEKKSD